MTNGLRTFKEKAAWFREHSALFSAAAETLDRFVHAVECGDLDQLRKEADATQALQLRLEKLGAAGNVFRFEVDL